jgi:hypothetical protein
MAESDDMADVRSTEFGLTVRTRLLILEDKSHMLIMECVDA